MFWGPQFYRVLVLGLIFGGQGGLGPQGPQDLPLLVKFYRLGRLLTSVLLCVVPFNVTFIALLVTAVTYVYVYNKLVNLEKVLKSIFINNKHINNT